MNANVLSSERIGSGVAAGSGTSQYLPSAVDDSGLRRVTAGFSMALNLPHPGIILTLAGYFGLLYLTSRFRNQGLAWCSFSG